MRTIGNGYLRVKNII